MTSYFKELLCTKPLQEYGESESIWFESGSESEKRWLMEDVKFLLIERVKNIAEEALTKKQKQVFALFLKGKSQREIAAILSISRNSVKSSWKVIIKKLQKHTTHLAYYWRLYLSHYRNGEKIPPILEKKLGVRRD